ncbi:hypothetical protein SLEP1_g39228 [Rubroshorea leprosula]|uniref:Uncharacterized protein n=1 Tax=Rubroshorea leprosula TaxID=152421 RepID=A0AAV5L0P6_9ROSI|nr:hypothetical protein SLEP1_g39228 [Rubroshorea leprosula]
MGAFYHEEQPRHPKRCKFLATALKDALSNWHGFHGRQLSISGPEESPVSEIDDEEEVVTIPKFISQSFSFWVLLMLFWFSLQVVVSEIRSKAMEKMKRRSSIKADSFSSWVFSPSTGEIYLTSKQREEQQDGEDDVGEEYFSAGSCLSRCSSAVSKEAFRSAKTNFSRSSSLSRLDSVNSWKFDPEDSRRRAIIQEFCQCEGWPFGLCRKLMLLPPLPKSPSDPWFWRKGCRITKTPYV